MENKLTDKGWSAMREMLDREMPEKQPNRPAFWLLIGLLLPMAAVGAWKWAHHNGRPATAVPATLQAQSRPSDQPAAASAYLHANVVPEPTGSPIPGQTAHKHPYAAQRSQVLHNAAVTLAALPAVAGQDAGSPRVQTVPPLLLVALAVPYPGAVAPPNPTATPAAPKKIEARPAEPTLVRPQADQTWKIGLSNLVTTETATSVNGFAAGMVADWQLSRKWGLRLGAQYSIYTPQANHRPVATVRSYEYIANISSGLAVFDGATGQQFMAATNGELYDSLGYRVLIPIRSLQRIEVPVSVFWKPWQSVKVLGGLSLNRTLAARADQEHYSGDYVLKIAGQSAEDSASKLSTTEMGRWSAEVALGTGIRVNQMFEVGLMARMPFEKLRFSSQQPNLGGTYLPSDLGTAKPNRPQSATMLTLYGTMYF